MFFLDYYIYPDLIYPCGVATYFAHFLHAFFASEFIMLFSSEDSWHREAVRGSQISFAVHRRRRDTRIGYVKIAIEHGPLEIVDVPIENKDS